jgi:apolipoprotein N-acyltransferase
MAQLIRRHPLTTLLVLAFGLTRVVSVPRTAASQGDPPRTPPRTGWAPWLWLAVGAALAPFAHLTNVIPVAAWLAPVFLLRFVRTQRARVAIPVMPPAPPRASAI